ncbi:MAG TPA: HAMP domain-containing sensor histidine kinase [Solirubrobacteraceae bacterium]|nr:HAMP domain-containing sensor histidine kinase [Solirubrobacteraceae bacterium]
MDRSHVDSEQVVAMVAHDLESSLLAVSRNADLLRKAGPHLSSEQEDRLAGIERTADRMKRLLASIRNLAQATVEIEPVALEDVMDEVREMLQTAVADRRAKIVTPDPLPVVLADRSQLVQLLQNLISNAIKFGPTRSGVVTVVATRLPDAWQVAVTDQGPGIAPADQERIFEPFRRLRGSRWQPGTGLGLAICKRIAENHGGTLIVESPAGAGSSFILTLPNPHPDPQPAPVSRIEKARLRPA